MSDDVIILNSSFFEIFHGLNTAPHTKLLSNIVGYGHFMTMIIKSMTTTRRITIQQMLTIIYFIM